ncbi:MAG: conjugal transfer protein TraF [Gammaproteobacteria bacterium]|nr:conjugal transfer protein TraF [Gammaproteobacteria bacterium]
MKLTSKILSVVALSVFSQVVSAIPFTFEGRSLAMGGVSVATADLATAAWANPAMLTNQRPGDDFSLLIGVGAVLRDDDDLVTDIQDFQDADDRRQAAKDLGDNLGEASAILDMRLILRSLEEKIIAPEVTGVVAMGKAFDSFAMAISLRGDVIAAGAVDTLSCKLGAPNCDIVEFEKQLTSDSYNILNIEGVLATEVGISFAKDFQILEKKVSIGIKPKIVDLQVFTLREPIINASTGFENLREEDTQFHLGTFTTVDLGFAVDLSDPFRLGLNIRNLITDDFDVLGQTLNFDTEARIGLAYRNRLLTLAVDYDLLENEPLLANPSFDGLKTRYIAVGAEFNTFDFAQLRIGASKNLASGISDGAKDTTLTAGIGFWLGFNLDVAATFRDNSIGGFIQTGFRF